MLMSIARLSAPKCAFYLPNEHSMMQRRRKGSLIGGAELAEVMGGTIWAREARRKFGGVVLSTPRSPVSECLSTLPLSLVKVIQRGGGIYGIYHTEGRRPEV